MRPTSAATEQQKALYINGLAVWSGSDLRSGRSGKREAVVDKPLGLCRIRLPLPEQVS